jgi:hypothetical protein
MAALIAWILYTEITGNKIRRKKNYFTIGGRISVDYNYTEETATIPDQSTTSLSSKR